MDIEGGLVGGGLVDGAGDHRCAMSFAILGQVAAEGLVVKGAENIKTSFPSFVKDLASVGGSVSND